MSNGLIGGNYFQGLLAPGSPLFGGAQLITGSTIVTLTDDLICNSLTMKDFAQIITNGYKIYAREFVRMSDSASIINPGANGADGGPNPGDGLGGLGAPAGTLGPGMNGGDSTDESGGDGFGEPFFAWAEGTGGAGGNGSGGVGGFGGSGVWLGSVAGTPFSHMVATTGWTFDSTTGDNVAVAVAGSGGGAGAGAGGGNTGGGGGGGGGPIFISTPVLILEDFAFIESRGGNGGNGVSANAGGGGPGSGGVIDLLVQQVQMKSSTCSIAAPAGLVGLGNGSGTNGSGGTYGWVYIFSEAGLERATQFLGSQYSVLPQPVQTF